MRLLPRASQVDAAIPKFIKHRLPRWMRPLQVVADMQIRRTKWRVYRKYDCRKDIEKFGSIALILFVVTYIQFRTPIEHFMSLPSSDPNKFLKDPYVVRQLTEEQERKYKMRKSIDDAGDELQATLQGYRKGHGVHEAADQLQDGAAARATAGATGEPEAQGAFPAE
uniref:Uncharacterized protein n=1 Tax=Neobodo designis TaxID=312471 RepID=A0A6U4NQ32_NEODS|mmetsp:Transcript_10106/g.31155  ORF Transcript_10106/g.31155 Transcript_10106/m.31155 type:complete len:167 (+) Transcript_10106:52-552(+)|eukprot:CAMPEP_0174831296 /NCGR_PEP_ID=MMETSP1114-20130205/3014_1 /TAXON_ID=312471 /ORGANISM="Neobodo designis, Strain CCAP 1951/1" /LENGTH=166 /DNA_ID=CAMNT_0016065117 /DNA_START=52 /DNA_END=552 /DNA_ORIENTATION=-